MSDEVLVDKGCWTIKRVDEKQPWLGTQVKYGGKHHFQWVAGTEMSQMVCMRCGTVKEQQSGKILSQVNPVIEAGRPPTEEELQLGSLSSPLP